MTHIKKFICFVTLAVFFAPAAVLAGNNAVLEKHINTANGAGMNAGLQAADIISPDVAAPAIISLTNTSVPELYTPALNIVRQEFNLPLLNVQVTKANVAYQAGELQNAVKFENALRMALKSYLNDYSDQKSPLAILYGRKNNCDGGEITPRAAEQLKPDLRGFLNRPTTVLRLLAVSERPEGEGNPEISWVFSLIVPEMYDTEHFAIVDRSGKKPVFNYGFN